MDEQDDLDVDFDFKSMLSHIDDPATFGVDLLSPPPPQSAGRGGAGGAPAAPPLHPRQHQALSIGEMLDSRLFKPDAPWQMGGNRTGLTAAPPPPSTFNGAVRSNRSGSGAIISSRLRAASDMHQQGYLTSEEKSLMKDLILSRNPRFKEEFTNAERTNNWYNLQQFLRTYHRHQSPANSFNMAIDDLATEFEALNTPPPPMHTGYSGMIAEAAAQSKSARKRMASQSTPVARPRKTTTSTKKLEPTSLMAIKARTVTQEDPSAAAAVMSEQQQTIAAPVASSAPPPSSSDRMVIEQPSSSSSSSANANAAAASSQRDSAASPPVPTTVSSPSSSTFVSSLPTKPISQMDDKELEIEAAIAAADGDSEAVAKIRKNERERRRRLAVSNGFDELFELLKLPQAAQIDKVSILRKAIDRIRELEAKVREYEEQHANNKKE